MSHKKSNGQKKRKSSSAIVARGNLPFPRSLLSAGVDLDAAVEMARQLRMESIKAELHKLIADGKGASAVDRVMSMLLDLERENERLSWRVLRAERYRFGRNTEKLSKDELVQLFLALCGDKAERASGKELTTPIPPEPEQTDDLAAVAADETEPQTAFIGPIERRKRQKVRRMVADPEMERIVTKVPVSAEDSICGLCGKPKTVFGCVEHERFEFVPAKIVLHVERREKAACTSCRSDVTVAPRTQPTDVVRKVGASLLAKLVTEKSAIALPIDRQRRQLRTMGLDVPYNTLLSYWGHTADLLEPIAEIVRSTVFGKAVVAADDTHLKMLNQSAEGGVSRGHLWAFVGTDGTPGGAETVAYGYTKSWKADEIADWFSSIDGFIQCDAYAGYAREVQDENGELSMPVPPERRLGCGMHIRRKFHDAFVSKDKRSAVPLKIIAELYKIEGDCQTRQLDAAARLIERQTRSLPLLDALDAWVDEIHPKLLPKSVLHRATTYAISQRVFFRRCFEDGRFEIDNGRVERRIRNFAVGRRNFLFTGSQRGGERLATVYTLVENCTILGIDPYEYVLDVITKREAKWPVSRLCELIPSRWAAEKAGQKSTE